MKEDRKRILEMVKNGEITIDEAERLLEELESIQSVKEKKEEHVANELSTYVQYDSSSNNEKQSYSSSQKSFFNNEKIMNFFDTILNKVKELELDFYNTVNIQHTFQLNDSFVKELNIDIPYGNIQLLAWDQNDIRVECDAKVFRTESLTEGREKFLRDMVCEVRDQVFVLHSKEKIMRVNAVIHIPRNLYEKAVIKLFNGSFAGEHLKIDVLTCKTANGKISLSDFEGTNADVETANGNILVTRSKIKSLEAETVNGKVDLDGTFDKLDVESISGTISGSFNHPEAETYRMQSAAGNIYIKVPNTQAVIGELKSNLGNVHANLTDLQIKDEKTDIIQKHLKFEKNGSIPKKLYIYAESKTGSVTVSDFVV